MAFKSRIFRGILVVCSLVLLANCAYKRYRVATTAPEPIDTTAVDPQEELVIEEKLAVEKKPDTTVVQKDSIAKVDTTKKDSVKKEPAKKVEIASKTVADTTKKQTSAKTEAASKTKKQAKPASKPTNLEKYAKEWLGAKYVYGAASKKKTDCSGYVMQVYKGFYNIALDHNAQRIYDDGRGYSIRRTKLQEGDLVFFGNFWKISHVGIYLKGNRFIHASTSKGVVITSMDDNYWSSKYKGARRFK